MNNFEVKGLRKAEIVYGTKKETEEMKETTAGDVIFCKKGGIWP